MEVILKPLNKNTWAGVNKYKNCYEDIGPYLLQSGLTYSAGLSDEDRERIGKKLSLDLSPTSTYWKNFKIRVGNDPIILRPADNAMDELKFLFLKGHKRVANSIAERNPTTRFVLVNKVDEAKKENEKFKVKRKAYKEFDKLSKVQIAKVLRLYGYNADLLDGEVAENKLIELIEQNPNKFLDLWVDNDNREIQFLIEEAISKNIIRRNKNIYKYGTETIGNSIEDTILWLKDLKNQDVKLAILNDIKAKS